MYQQPDALEIAAGVGKQARMQRQQHGEDDPAAAMHDPGCYGFGIGGSGLGQGDMCDGR